MRFIAAKHAIRALGAAVRQETKDAPGIRVATILPAAIDTPFFRNGANVTGLQAVPPGPRSTPVGLPRPSCALRAAHAVR